MKHKTHIKKLFLDLSMLNPYCILFYGQLRHNCVISLSRKMLTAFTSFFGDVNNLEIEETVRGQIKMVMVHVQGNLPVARGVSDFLLSGRALAP
jgi:hypothetical protein